MCENSFLPEIPQGPPWEEGTNFWVSFCYLTENSSNFYVFNRMGGDQFYSLKKKKKKRKKEQNQSSGEKVSQARIK